MMSLVWLQLFRTATYLKQHISTSYEGFIRSVVITYTAEREFPRLFTLFVSDVPVVIYAGIIYHSGYFLHRWAYLRMSYVVSTCAEPLGYRFIKMPVKTGANAEEAMVISLETLKGSGISSSLSRLGTSLLRPPFSVPR